MFSEQEKFYWAKWDSRGKKAKPTKTMLKPLFLPNKVSRMSWLFSLLFRNIPTGVIKCMNSPYKT